MMRVLTYLLIYFSVVAYGQGIINNGARIVFNTGGNIYINTAGTGHYTSQAGGNITNNTAGGVMTVMGNWVNNSANLGFTNDGATVFLSGNNQTIGGTNSTTFYNLNLIGGGTKTLLINTTTGGQALNNGVLSLGTRPMDLNTFRLTVTNSAIGAITNTSGHIISETNVAVNPSVVRWFLRTTTGAHVYPFGVAGLQIPFTFNVTTAMPGAADYVDVSTRATSNPSNTPWAGPSNVGAVTHMFSPIIGADGSVQVVIDRWWDITSSSAVTADVTFSYRGVENTLIAPYNTGNLGAQHWDGSFWNPPVGSAPAVLAGVGSVTAPGLNTFSPWVLSSLLAPLPIELVNFGANCINGSILLSWSTATEKSNNFFTIEKSDDGKNYQTLATVKGSGNSNVIKNYSYNDDSRDNKIVYYRLSQTDIGGSTKICKAIVAEPCSLNKNEIKIINTKDGQVSVAYILEQDEDYSVSVFDMMGRKVMSETVNASKGYFSSNIKTNDLPPSYYMLVIQGSSTQMSQKVYISNQ